MNKTYNETDMKALLTNLNAHLALHTDEYPGLVPVVKALAKAAENPTKTKEVKVKPVTIEYEGKDLLVKNTPFPKGPQWQVSVALKEAFNALVGRKSKKVNPETGQPYFLTSWDKKAKGFRIPAEKEQEVKTAIQKLGLTFEVS